MDRMTFVYIGFAPMFILMMFASYKKLRNNRILNVLLVVTILFAIPGILIKTPEAAMFTGSFIYVATYASLRFLFIRKYHFEPTYNRSSWYDADEGRRQNWFDVVVFVVPLLLSFIIPLFLIIAKAKRLF